jgi:hypothetical protein
MSLFFLEGLCKQNKYWWVEQVAKCILSLDTETLASSGWLNRELADHILYSG